MAKTKSLPSGKQIGVVKWFNDEKGFGFITTEDGADVFVHYTGIEAKGHRSLAQGDGVEFYIEANKATSRTNAVMVKKLEVTGA